MRDLMTIGKAAALAGVSADTIRYYERLGLFPTPTRTRAGYRVYQPAIINRRRTLRGWDRRLEETPAGTPGRLLENL
jgi:DNA-binding transcriptional MerR regulator